MPVISGSTDPLREGASVSMADAMRVGHPVESLQRDALTSPWERKVYSAQRVYGGAAAMEMRLDRAILSQFQRGPGLESSFAGLDSLLGRDETLGFEDYLNGEAAVAGAVSCGAVPHPCVMGCVSLWCDGLPHSLCLRRWSAPGTRPDLPKYTPHELFERKLKM